MSAAMLPGANQPDNNRGHSILAACGTMTVLALVAVCCRIWALSLTGMGIIIPEVLNGAGRHIVYLDPVKATTGLKLNFATQPIYLWAITIVKVSIALFLQRIAPNKIYKRWLWGIIVFLIAYTFACFLTIILQCTNLAVLWDPTTKATCWTPKTLRSLSYVNSSLNIATDLVFAALPIPMLWNVQIKGRVKASLICIMGLGVFACVASMIKMSYLPKYGKTGDFLWDSTYITIWTVVECNTGIITSCLACLKPLFRRILEKSFKSYGSSKGNDNSHSLRVFSQGGMPSSENQKAHTSTHVTSTSKGIQRGDLEGNSSEEMILFQGPVITKTTEVIVDNIGIATPDERSSWPRKNNMTLERKVEDNV
ncbi:related to integral membrane protein [Phialocephala subalpina]|uniref:Related to integral membrane protein n=1 Tax=Phialocephala subalpina TaxID=576137 RepID=A0A1L7WBJ6_9HELO|nr:related to integral membrane protein [Phialocephala subalpina]